MSIKRKKIYLILVVLFFAFVIAAGCTGSGDESAGKINKDSASGEELKKAVLIAIPYDTELSSANVLKIVLREAGYDIEIKTVDVGIAWQGLSSGSGDFYVGAWLPTCHGQYLEKFGDDIVFVRKNLEGTRCGLAVPDYVKVNSIAEMNANKELFDSEIVGIEPGAGIMKGTEDAVESYSLDYNLLTGSEVGMCTALKSAIDSGEPIVVTAWSPHWMFVKWDLKYLDDPENVYGGEEYIASYTRKGLKEDMPDLYSFIERFHWETSDMESIMLDMNEGMSAEDAAQKWVDNNPELVNEWLDKTS
ncbi:glycine betaine ABC transporter substrate-binding protein [Methanochimaera problematica]|uniref:glycine betaine ABC transporter substrate-binding protein n=1 Tax=Methanochimaera problematica TaxID=2609417 RepID=UPI0029393F58|nr:glycine betaine ABC transporter substrate-binding protein [Methanoplanus sp. FWC-SCC4]